MTTTPAQSQAPGDLALSDDQAAAFAAVAAALRRHGVDLSGGATMARADGPAEVMAVLGRAGSGKTRLLSLLVEALSAAGLEPVTGDWEGRRNKDRRSFAVLAPTNKAASVLRNLGVPATTIHRIIYTPVYDPQFEKIAEWLAGEGERPEVENIEDEQLDRVRASYERHKSIPGALAAIGLRGSDFITGWARRDDPLDIALVDEASMLDDKQLEDLRQIFGLIVLFGDPAQLAPVGQSGAMVFDALGPDRRIELSRIHRQAAGNPILDIAHALSDPDIGFEDFERLIERAARQDPRVVVAERADPTLMARSPMLVWRNATRIRLIDAFRKVHGAPEDALLPGEPLICDGIELPARHRKKRIDLEARGLVKGAQCVYLGPGRRKGFAKLHILGAEEPQISVASIIRIERPDQEEPFIPAAAAMGATFVHGAAATIHKAQGSQWPSVQVFAPDLWAACRAGRSDAGMPLWKRLAYVAVTRAEERLIWVTRNRMARPQASLGVEDLRLAAPAPLTLSDQDPDG
ncbi:ATP-dependent DNA helicase [Oceanicella actignis]|uniref:Exodeoxyribonuclease-5 n=1 Tax=Oceanicella actignis TaxID=1189325 RepID=A0A1M7T2Z2_9RHOB|nr:AAA family ATPase [Oceanicella actignis]SET39561.1 exodeoxyribonuclease-5 [Oceanicella actignis]SHN65057.1 exodeoxyribonuclease-5 [Oceanicella actignis]